MQIYILFLFFEVFILISYSLFSTLTNPFLQSETQSLIFYISYLSSILGYALFNQTNKGITQQKLYLVLLIVSISTQLYPVCNFLFSLLLFEFKVEYKIELSIQMIKQGLCCSICCILIESRFFKVVNTYEMTQINKQNNKKYMLEIFSFTFWITLLYTFNQILCKFISLKIDPKLIYTNNYSIILFLFAGITIFIKNYYQKQIIIYKKQLLHKQKLNSIMHYLCLVFLLFSNMTHQIQNTSNVTYCLINNILCASSCITTSCMLQMLLQQKLCPKMFIYCILSGGIFIFDNSDSIKQPFFAILFGVIANFLTYIYIKIIIIFKKQEYILEGILILNALGCLIWNSIFCISYKILLTILAVTLILSVILAQFFIKNIFLQYNKLLQINLDKTH